VAYPETSETSSWGHPNFRAGTRIFSAFAIVKGRPSIPFRLEPTDINRLLRNKNFFATPYGQGRSASMWVDGPVDWRLVARRLSVAHSLPAPSSTTRQNAGVGSSSTAS
jgi:hypothetical protein